MTVSQAEFAGLAIAPAFESTADHKLVEEGMITIVKLSFEPHLIWDFIYKGDKHSAYIRDKKFWLKVKGRQINFADGDQLSVKLSIEQEFSDQYKAYVNTGRMEILEVFDVIHYVAPPTLF